jgi:hypothetical protein
MFIANFSDGVATNAILIGLSLLVSLGVGPVRREWRYTRHAGGQY